MSQPGANLGAMSDGLERFLSLDIPENLHLSRNIQTMVARATVAGASPDETAKVVLGIVIGNVMEIEQRLVSVEERLGIQPSAPQPIE